MYGCIDVDFYRGQAFAGMPFGLNPDFDYWRTGEWSRDHARHKAQATSVKPMPQDFCDPSIRFMSAACPVPAFPI